MLTPDLLKLIKYITKVINIPDVLSIFVIFLKLTIYPGKK